MSEPVKLRVAEQVFSVAAGSNLLDVLLELRLPVSYSCRAGSCQACQVRWLSGDLDDAQPELLSPQRYAQGWRLACQCQLLSDVELALFDLQRDAIAAQVKQCQWRAGQVLHLALEPERPIRYRAGDHLLLWSCSGVARPYSLASLSQQDTYLEFHIDCSEPGLFCDFARQLDIGDSVHLGQISSGALHYDPQWSERPLWLWAAGTGLAPLWGIVREALRQQHQGPIELLHVVNDGQSHYWRDELETLQRRYPALQLRLLNSSELPAYLAQLRLVSRQTTALVCGSPLRVEALSKRLFMLGVPRGQVLTDLFLPPA